MPIKKSALLLIALSASSITVLVYSASKAIPADQKIGCCKKIMEKELFVPWNILSQSMPGTRV